MKDSSKLKRKISEIQEMMEEEKELKDDKQKYLQESKRLKNERRDVEDQMLILKRDKEHLIDMFETNNLGS